MTRASCVTLAIVIAVFLNAPGDALAWCQARSESQTVPGVCAAGGVALQWQRACVSYTVDGRDSLDLSLSEISNAVEAGFSNWTNVDCGGGQGPSIQLEMTEETSYCRKAEFNSGRGNVNTVAFLTQWCDNDDPYTGCDDPGDQQLDPEAIAVTITWYTPTGRIVDADMLINEQKGPFTTCPASGCKGSDRQRTDLESIVSHEAGHFLGIGHSGEVAATMYYRYARGTSSSQTLEQDDIDAVCTMYSADLGSCSFTPEGGLATDCEHVIFLEKNGCTIGYDGGAEENGRWGLMLFAMALIASRRRIFGAV